MLEDSVVGSCVVEAVVFCGTGGEVIVGMLVVSVGAVVLLGTSVVVVKGRLELPDCVGMTVESVELAIEVGIETVEEPVPRRGGSERMGDSELEVEAEAEADVETVGAVPGNDVVGKRVDGNRVGSSPLSVPVLVSEETPVPDSVLDSVAFAVGAGRIALVTPPTALVTPPTTLVTPPISPPSELVGLWLTTPVGAIRIPEDDEGTAVVGSVAESVADAVAVPLVESAVVDTSTEVPVAVPSVVPVVAPVADAVLLAETDAVSAPEVGNKEGISKLSVGKEISGDAPDVVPMLPPVFVDSFDSD